MMKAASLAALATILPLLFTAGLLPEATLADPDEWTRIELPRVDWHGANQGAIDLDMVSPDFGVVVGTAGMWEYRAGTFIPAAQTLQPGGWPVGAVDLISETYGWAVGSEGLILHFDGQSWQAVTRPTPYGLCDVAVLSPSDGWAIGQGSGSLAAGGDQIFHHDGSQWRPIKRWSVAPWAHSTCSRRRTASPSSAMTSGAL